MSDANTSRTGRSVAPTGFGPLVGDFVYDRNDEPHLVTSSIRIVAAEFEIVAGQAVSEHLAETHFTYRTPTASELDAWRAAGCPVFNL